MCGIRCIGPGVEANIWRDFVSSSSYTYCRLLHTHHFYQSLFLLRLYPMYLLRTEIVQQAREEQNIQGQENKAQASQASEQSSSHTAVPFHKPFLSVYLISFPSASQLLLSQPQSSLLLLPPLFAISLTLRSTHFK